MPHRSISLTILATLLAVFAFAGCGVNTDRVKDAIPTSTPTTTADDAKRAETTTTKPDSSTTVPDDSRPADSAAVPYIDAMAASMTKDDDFPGTAEDARCFATKVVDVIGVDRLQTSGTSPEQFGTGDESLDMSSFDLTEDEGNSIYDALKGCNIDLRATMLEDLGEGSEIPPEAKACLDQILTDDNLRKLMVTSMIEGDDAAENDPELKGVMGGLMGCMFMAMGSDSTTE